MNRNWILIFSHIFFIILKKAKRCWIFYPVTYKIDVTLPETEIFSRIFKNSIQLFTYYLMIRFTLCGRKLGNPLIQVLQLGFSFPQSSIGLFIHLIFSCSLCKHLGTMAASVNTSTFKLDHIHLAYAMRSIKIPSASYSTVPASVTSGVYLTSPLKSNAFIFFKVCWYGDPNKQQSSQLPRRRRRHRPQPHDVRITYLLLVTRNLIFLIANIIIYIITIMFYYIT